MGNGVFQNLLKDAAGGFFGNDYLRDYTHASKTFGANSLYQNAPKQKFLFHCYFSINQFVYDLDSSFAGNFQNFGLLVRDVKLPSYQFATHQMNQYNRKRIVQSKIKYNPVQFSFFDDNGNTMNKLWAAYYTYYYNDGAIPAVQFGGQKGGFGQDLSSVAVTGKVRGLAGAGTKTAAPVQDPDYKNRNIYENDLSGKLYYGYNGSNDTAPKKPNFFSEITIYGFYQKNFIAYTLINPVITEFAHDTYDYNEATGIMKNTMSLDYETVVYNEGAIDGEKPSNLVPGFGDIANYDRTKSPIAMPGSTSKILGKDGLIDSVGGALKGAENNPLGAIRAVGAAYNTLKNTDIKQTLKTELKNSLINNLRQKPNTTRNLSFEFVNAESSRTDAMAAGAPATGTVFGTDSAQNTNPNNTTKTGTDAKGNPILNGLKNLGKQVLGGFTDVGQAVATTVQDATRVVGTNGIDLRKLAEKPAGKQSNSGGSVNSGGGG